MHIVAQYSCTVDYRKHIRFQIINLEDDKNWYTAEIAGKIGLVPVNYIKMKIVP